MLYLGAFSERERILDIDAQVADGALDFRAELSAELNNSFNPSDSSHIRDVR